MLGAVHRRPGGFSGWAKPGECSFGALGLFTLFKKQKQEQKTKHHHSINAIPGSPPFSLPVLLAYTVWVFITFCWFGPSSLGLRHRLAGQSLSSFLQGRACLSLGGGEGGGPAGTGRAGCGVGAALALAWAAATLRSLRPAFTARWSAARGAAAACRR